MAKITNDKYDNALNEILREYDGCRLLSEIPEIYEAVSEHFNNEVIDSIQNNEHYEKLSNRTNR